MIIKEDISLSEFVRYFAKVLAETQELEEDYAFWQIREYLCRLFFGFEHSPLAQWLENKNRKMLELGYFHKEAREFKEFTASFYAHLASAKPLAYFFGFTEFWGLNITVGRGALVPRSDSEILVEEVIANLKQRLAKSLLDFKKIFVLELCTGSAALSLAVLSALRESFNEDFLKECLIWEISDISENAIWYAQKNINRYDNLQIIKLSKSDLFSAHQNKYDIIFANPPYIADIPSEHQKMDISVRKFEPLQALFAGIDGLDFYRLFFQQLRFFVKEGSSIFLEHGYQQAVAVKNIAKEQFLVEDGTCREILFKTSQDYAGRDRVFAAQLV